MPYSERLVNIIREALVDIPVVEEKKMFRGVCFMVNDKMCICISGNELLCRIGPEVYAEALEKAGTRAMIKNGKSIKDFVFVREDELKNQSDFDYWIDLSLAFNKYSKSSKKKN